MEPTSANSRIPLQMFRRRAIRVSWLLALGYLLFCCAAGILIADSTLHPGRRLLSDEDRLQAAAVAERHEARLHDIEVDTLDGITLRGWELRPPHRNGESVILLHGLSDNRMGMIGYAELPLTHGFTVVVPDARAHGVSGGETATYGLLESGDIHQWLDWIQASEHPTCVFGFGESMGAAQLLQSLRGKPEFWALAAESPFSDFREIAYDRVGQFFHTGPWPGRSLLRPVVEIAFIYAHCRYHFDLETVSPERALSRTHIVDPWSAKQQHPDPPFPRHRGPQSSRGPVGSTRCRPLRCHKRSPQCLRTKTDRMVRHSSSAKGYPLRQLDFPNHHAPTIPHLSRIVSKR